MKLRPDSLPRWLCRILVSIVFLPTFALAQQAPDSQVPAAAQRSKPYRRAEWFWSQRAYPQGFIPNGARTEALRQLDKMLQDEAQTSTTKFSGVRGLALASGSASPASGTVWTPMGPQPTSNVFSDTPVSGRLTSIVVDPTNANTMYVGSANGGVWKTTDGGANWTPLTDDQPTLAVGAVAMDPDNLQNIWVGTGEGEFGADNYYGVGILKSTNGGSSWTQLASSTFGGAINSIPPNIGGGHINSIAILKGSGGQVALATAYWFQQFISFAQRASGVYRTTDGGTTWTNVLQAAAGNVVAWDPNNAVNCGNACIAYATIGDPFGDTQNPNGSSNGFYRSTDSGQTWTKITSGLPSSSVGRIAMGLAKNNSQNTVKTTIYLGIGNSSTMDALGIWKSTDGGLNFSLLNNAPNYCPTQCFYDNVVAVLPSNDAIVFAGGSFSIDGSSASILWRSVDGGATWAEVSKASSAFFSSLHADLHAIAFSPDNGTLYAGTDGGIYASSNVTNSATAASSVAWSNLNGSSTDVTHSLALTQFYPGMSIANANFVLGGTQDNGTQLFTGNIVWNEMACGDGGGTAIDPGNSNNIFIACNTGPIDIKKSTSATPSHSTFSSATSGITTDDRAAFIPPLAIDPNNGQVLYFGSFRLYRTSNAASSWTAMAGGADLTGGGNAKITAIGVGPNNTVWVGTSGSGSSITSKVQVSTNANLAGSATFTDRTDTSVLPSRAVTQVMPDFADSTGNTAYVTFSGFDQFQGGGDGRGYVYKTTNGGANWSNITGNLPHSPVNDIVIDPAAAGTLYVATDVGVFSTTDGGSTWTTLVSGLPKSAVLSLKLHSASRTLVAGTHGRSAWRVIVGAAASAAPSSLSFSAIGLGATSTPQTVTVSNTGGASVTLNTLSITGNPTEFAIYTPSTTPRSARAPRCVNGTVLGAGASCLVYVTFTPAGSGARSGTLTISNTGSVSSIPISLSGTGPTAGVVSLLPNPVAFGNVALNGYSTIPVRLSNSTGNGITVGAITPPTGYSQSNDCSGTIAAGSGCTITLTFHPTSLSAFNGNLSVLDTAAGSPHSTTVSGTGGGSITLTSPPNQVAGTPAGIPSSITLSHPPRVKRSDTTTVIAGSAALVPITFAPDGATGTASLSCYGAPAGTTCDVEPSTLNLRGRTAHANVKLRYIAAPDSAAPGEYQVQVVARTDAFTSVLPVAIELAPVKPRETKTAANSDEPPSTRRNPDEPAPRAFELSATRIEFGADDRRADARARTISLSNLQATPLLVSVDSVSGDFLQTNDCPAELPVASRCTISVRLKPDATFPQPGRLTITTAAGSATVDLLLK